MTLIRPLLKVAVALVVVGAAGFAQAQAFINGTISGQLAPGVYGQVNIGNAPPPLMYAQPMWGGPVVPQVQPIYMWVPPGHARNWRRHCGRYNACGKPVYFLRDAPPHWRSAAPAPRPGPRYGHDHEGPRHWDRDDRRYDRGDRHERRERREHRGWDRGDQGHQGNQGNGHGRGHGRHRE